jgi:hypothetical protein
MRVPEGAFPTVWVIETPILAMRNRWTAKQAHKCHDAQRENVNVAINATISSKNYGLMAGQSMN